MYTAICLWVFQWVNGVCSCFFRRLSTGKVYVKYSQCQDTRMARKMRRPQATHPGAVETRHYHRPRGYKGP